ncbi:MAG: peptidoglycan editing factor PgeF [Myxococcaceae bacterium]
MLEQIFLAKQVHGTRALRVTHENKLEDIATAEADALWTTEPGILVGIKTADCGPVLLRHKNNLCVAAIHAGWRGAVAGIIPKTLSDICQKLNLKPVDFEAEVGPCIGFGVYEIGPEVAAQVPGAFLKPGHGDKSYFDLRGLLRCQLEQAGIKNITVSTSCTYSEPENYYSARRGDSGRQVSFIGI